jgi:hypothetical protein
MLVARDAESKLAKGMKKKRLASFPLRFLRMYFHTLFIPLSLAACWEWSSI